VALKPIPNKSLFLSLFIAFAFFIIQLLLVYKNYSETKLEIKYDRELTDLMSSAYKLSEESFHTQLELWEYAYHPTSERLEHFHAHELALKTKYKNFYDSILLQQDKVDLGAVNDLTKVFVYYQKIWTGWDQAIANYLENHNTKIFQDKMFELEELFDKSQINNQINKLIDVHAARIENSRVHLNDKAYSRFLTSTAILCMLFLMIVFYIVYINLREKKILLQLIQTEKMTTLGQMSASMAHEINTPLMFVKGFNNRVRSTIKKEGLTNPELIEYLDDIDDGIERMSLIVNHLRNFTREGKREKTLFSVDTIISSSFSFFNEQLKHSNISYKLELHTESTNIHGDPNRMEQVFINLISNSRDALVINKSVSIKEIIVRSNVKNGQVLITFADNGGGIDKKDMNRIFEPFFTTKQVGKGTGLGLPIIKEIINEHDGSIKVTSIHGKETKFTITIPIKV
jgi:signal transduction histidine kinase